MKHTTLVPISHEQQTPTTTSDYKTFTVPNGASAILVSVATTNARISLDGSNPDATHGHVFPKDVAPALIPVAQGSAIVAASTAAASAVVDITYLA